MEKILDLRLKKSKFGHFFENGSTICLYNSLKIITLYIDQKILKWLNLLDGRTLNQVLKDLPKNLHQDFIRLVKDLVDAEIFMSFYKSEIEYLEKIKPLIFKKPNIRVAVLHLTDYCNLKCKYCFIEGSLPADYQRNDMSIEVMKASIDKFADIVNEKVLPKKPSIVFYGGEPLANWQTIKFGLEYIRQKQHNGQLMKINKVIITNGTLLNQEMCEVLNEHNVHVGLSMDGPEEFHDRNRVYHDGTGTFKDVYKNFKLLKANNISLSIASVLAKSNVDYISEIMHWLLDDLGMKALGFNHESILPNISEYDEEYEKKFAKAIIKGQEIIQQHEGVYERRMNHKINTFLNREILKSDCTGCGEQISISTMGEIGICQGYMGSRKTFKGSVFDDKYDVESDPVFIEWSKRSPLYMSQCMECAALSVCGGGCPRNADFLHGSIWEKDTAFCHFAKLSLEWMIWKKYEAMNM